MLSCSYYGPEKDFRLLVTLVAKNIITELQSLNVPDSCYLFDDYYVKGKVLPYSLPSIGLGADPGVQTVSPHVTF